MIHTVTISACYSTIADATCAVGMVRYEIDTTYEPRYFADEAVVERLNETLHLTRALTPDWAPAARPPTRTWRPEQKASGYG